LSSATALQSTLNTANTAFGTQTNAFVGSPANPQPNQPGGGVWVRGIGGRVDNSAVGTVAFVGVPGTFQCNSTFRSDYAGFQIGADVARLNINGGGTNVHVGLTGGFLTGSGHELTGVATGGFDIPFVGVYAAMTSGGFFADALLREDFYSGHVTQPQVGLNNQGVSGRATSLSGTAGYQFRIGASSFIEPSGALIWANFRVDPIAIAGAGTVPAGTIFVDTIHSTLGRFGGRIGTTFTSGNLVLTPFVAANVWHEFAGNANSTFVAPGTGFSLSTSRVGTFGQYGVGIAGQVPNTGWLGYARVDYRKGDNIEGVGVNLGLRYQFSAGPTGPVLRR